MSRTMRGFLAIWAVVAVVVIVVALVDDKDETSSATQTTAACKPVSIDVQSIGDGLGAGEWVQLSIRESVGGFTSIVQLRTTTGRYTWAVDQHNGTIDGFVAALDQRTADASGFSYDPAGDYGAAQATIDVLSRPEYDRIDSCNL